MSGDELTRDPKVRFAERCLRLRKRIRLGPKTVEGGIAPSWRRDVELPSGAKLRVGVYAGRFARGMYGVNGRHWIGWVQNADGTSAWRGRVPKGAGAASILIDALDGGADLPGVEVLDLLEVHPG